ncbi:MAG: hypothetical protein ACW99G_02795 [Candidatus Thorarchaeota archaeon]
MKELVTELQEELKRNGLSASVHGVNGTENSITLTGNTKSFYQKQLAQEICMQKTKSDERNITVHNEIFVEI